MSSRNFYDILGVESNAEQNAIRKAYLKLSLKHHPDKNPDNVEEAKAKFIEIGTAYETLSDPQKRAIYDRELRSGRSGFTPSFSSSSSSAAGAGTGAGGGGSGNADFMYDKFSDFFDANVAGMSEEDLAAAVGTVAMIGSLVGSIVGSRMLSGGKRGAGGALLGTAGSLVGSALASEMAASSVKALHQKSIQRVQYKEACRRAVERGEPIPDPPEKSQWDVILEKTVETVKGVANTAMNGQGNNNNNSTSSNNNTNRSDTGADRVGNLWQKAAAGVKMAQAAAEAKKATNNYR